MTIARTEVSPGLALDRDALLELGRSLAGEYAAAQPFSHVVIDGLFPESVLDRIVAEFPVASQMEHQFDQAYELKAASSAWAAMGPVTRSVLGELNLGTFIEFLEVLTGIHGLVPDPALVGGGLHQIPAGGRLGVHADFNVHRFLQLDRRLNLLLYLNRDWEDEWGGHLELWDAETMTCVDRITPDFNRCVVFSVSDRALHGHPDTLTCPPDNSRKISRPVLLHQRQARVRACARTQDDLPQPTRIVGSESAAAPRQRSHAPIACEAGTQALVTGWCRSE